MLVVKVKVDEKVNIMCCSLGWHNSIKFTFLTVCFSCAHFPHWAHSLGSRKNPSQTPGSLFFDSLGSRLSFFPQPRYIFLLCQHSAWAYIFSSVLITPVKVLIFYLEGGVIHEVLTICKYHLLVEFLGSHLTKLWGNSIVESEAFKR